jgi:hypothetical protein
LLREYIMGDRILTWLDGARAKASTTELRIEGEMIRILAHPEAEKTEEQNHNAQSACIHTVFACTASDSLCNTWLDHAQKRFKRSVLRSCFSWDSRRKRYAERQLMNPQEHFSICQLSTIVHTVLKIIKTLIAELNWEYDLSGLNLSNMFSSMKIDRDSR